MQTKQRPFFKDRILTAGPTPVPEFVTSAMSSSLCYHRSPTFSAIMQDCRSLLPKIFGSKQEALIFSGSGTLAMEGAIANFLNSGDKVIAVNGGKFGARWAEQARCYGCDVQEIIVERGKAVDLEQIEALMKEHPEAKALLLHSSETSTGVRHDIKGASKLAHALDDCLMMVDGITSVGVFEIPMDKWGVDVMVGGSQKAMMLPPGLAFGCASERAWQRSEKCKNVRYYMDWRKEKKASAKNTGAFTSAVTLVGGLRAVLRHYDEVGFENVFRRNWKMCAATRASAEAMGFELLVKNISEASAACTALKVNSSHEKILKNNYSLTLSGGQDELKGKIVRVAHMGFIDGWDLLSSLLGLARCAQMAGDKIDLQKGVEVFWKVIDDPSDATPEDLKNA